MPEKEYPGVEQDQGRGKGQSVGFSVEKNETESGDHTDHHGTLRKSGDGLSDVSALLDRRKIFCAEGFDFSPVIDMQTAAAQPLYVQVHSVLKGHGGKRKAAM